MHVFLNNKFIQQDKASIAINDRGFLLADGFFTTLLAKREVLIHFDQHFERLASSAVFFAIPLLINKNDLFIAIQQLITKNNLNNVMAAVRISVTRGQGDRGIIFPKQVSPTLLITAFPFEKPNKTYRLMLSSFTRSACSPLSSFKTLSYLEHVMARDQAKKEGFDDAIMLNEHGRVVCTTTANIFLTIDNTTLLTPCISEGALPGIERATFIKQAEMSGKKVIETFIDTKQLAQAHSILITNSLIGVQNAHYTNA